MNDSQYIASCAGRIAEALERMASADERRNDILEREMAQRQAAWEASEARQAEALAQLLQPQQGVFPAADPWRDLPERQPGTPLSERVHPG